MITKSNKKSHLHKKSNFILAISSLFLSTLHKTCVFNLESLFTHTHPLSSTGVKIMTQRRYICRSYLESLIAPFVEFTRFKVDEPKASEVVGDRLRRSIDKDIGLSRKLLDKGKPSKVLFHIHSFSLLIDERFWHSTPFFTNKFHRFLNFYANLQNTQGWQECVKI